MGLWKRVCTLSTLDTGWMRLIGERWRTDKGADVDYWRTENADSVIVIPQLGDAVVLPDKMFRPGVGRETLDFPGGRCPAGRAPELEVNTILQRELGIAASLVSDVVPLTPMPLLVNSSTSNQRLFGFHVMLSSQAASALFEHHAFRLDDEGIRDLLGQLECLQCRSLLMEFLLERALV